MRWLVAPAAIAAFTSSSALYANDWEKFFTRSGSADYVIPSSVPAERINSAGSIDADIGAMWKRGYAPIGYSSFTNGNSKTKDAERLANKLKARYYIALTVLSSSYTTSVPLTLPSSTTSNTNGNFSVFGSGGYNSGNFSGTTTTYGSQTTYLPMQMNRYSKLALYFGEAPRMGTGIYPRELNADEISTYETQRGFVIGFIRDGSPAYEANLLPGDVIVEVNGLPADAPNWAAAVKANEPMHVKLFRNGEPREITMTVPTEWKPKP